MRGDPVDAHPFGDMQDTTEFRERDIRQITVFGAVLNAALSAAKLLAGIFGHSTAMVADAVHSFSDFATDLAVAINEKYVDDFTCEA